MSISETRNNLKAIKQVFLFCFVLFCFFSTLLHSNNLQCVVAFYKLHNPVLYIIFWDKSLKLTGYFGKKMLMGRGNEVL